MSRYLARAFWIKALVTGVILYLVLSRVELHVAAEMFRNIQLPFLVAALILLPPMVFTAAQRWRSVAVPAARDCPFGPALLYCWIGNSSIWACR